MSLFRNLQYSSLFVICLMFAWPAAAHVKWFAPYIVGAPPQPISSVLGDQWYWIGLALVVVFFLVTRFVEVGWGGRIHDAIDYVTAPLWHRLDDYVRVTIGAFFVAIFSVGGVYLTPDLKTPAEWVSWLQLLIGAFIFFRTTMPLAGIGIIALWLLALRDYDLFHLFDYLALGVGVAVYLIVEPSKNERLRSHRFEVLRWGLAIALMWSSLEKFAFPDWFYPLVEEKPFLTFGMPRDIFIPMAGIAEFTMGFGLLWTPLIRRLSAMALLVIFTAAVWPFGRTDLVGHGLIMAILVAVICDRSRTVHFLPWLKAYLAAIPPSLAVVMTIFMTGYWGLHFTFYGTEGFTAGQNEERATHSFNEEHPHGPKSDTGIGAPPTK